MKLVYVCTPYNTDTPEAFEQSRQSAIVACREIREITSSWAGEPLIPYAPVLCTPYLLEDRRRKPIGNHTRLGAAMNMLTKSDWLVVAGDELMEDMRKEIQTAVRMGLPVMSMRIEQAHIQAVADEMPPLLDKNNILEHGDTMNYKNELLILRESSLAPWAMEPEQQLWIGCGGFGLSPNSRGDKVSSTCLTDGKEAQWRRESFYSVADPAKLPAWAKERLAEMQAQTEPATTSNTNIQNEELEDMEQ